MRRPMMSAIEPAMRSVQPHVRLDVNSVNCYFSEMGFKGREGISYA
jgi:hypothetical protein